MLGACCERSIPQNYNGVVDAMFCRASAPIGRRCATRDFSFLMANQFPVFTTFMKLTLLNHLFLYNFPSQKDFDGKVRFFVRGPK